MNALARLRQAPPATVDAVIAAVVAVPTFMDAWWNEPGTRQADAATYLLTAVSVLALLARRRWPIPVAALCGAALSALYLLGHHGELLNLPTMVALYTVAVQGNRRTSIIAGVIASAWSGVLGFTSDDPIGARGGSPVLEMIWPLIPIAFGEATRVSRELVAHAKAERDREADRRVEAERTRMAREFHDVVAHTMAAVNVQMAAAVAAFDTKPDTARQALQQARASSKMALQELRATVALLRATDNIAPAPGIDEIESLIAVAQAAGIAVVVHADPDRVAVSGATGVAAYRVVQEALTNIVRHSDARHALVSLCQRPEGLVIEVVDDGTTARGDIPSTSGRFGLVGMTERVRAVGGRLEYGPGADGGFRVRAQLPASQASP